MNKILDQTVQNVTIQEVIKCSKILQKLFFWNLSRQIGSQNQGDEVQILSIEVQEARNLIYATSTPKAKVRLDGGDKCIGLIDTGAEVNVMTTALAIECGLPIRPRPRLSLVSHNSIKRQFARIYKVVEINIRGVIITQNIFVIIEADNVLILGQPQMKSRRVSFKYIKEGPNSS